MRDQHSSLPPDAVDATTQSTADSARGRLSHDEIIERSHVLMSRLEGRAAEGEQLRQLPPGTIADLEALDLFRMVVPSSLGGHGLGLDTLSASTRILGRGCAATAWTASFLIMHNWMLTRFPAAAHQELFRPERPWANAPAPLAPTGSIRPTEGGFVLSGRWEWATGVRHADWVIVHAVQTEPSFATRFALLPIADVHIGDSWHTSGMRATGSETVEVTEVFVPAHRTIPSSALLETAEPIAGDAMAGLPVAPVLALMAAAPALGAAERAVELFRERIAARVLAYSMGERAVEQSAAQMRLGTVMAELAAAQHHWTQAIDELSARAAGTDRAAASLSIEQRVAMRLTAAHTVRTARRIVNTIAEGSGASVYFIDSPFQRIQRDLEVLKGHVIFDWDRTTELAGKVALGLDLKPTDMV